LELGVVNNDVSVGSLQSHLRAMLEDLSDLAENSGDAGLCEIALRLRLIAGEPALRSSERDVDETLLSCEQTGLQLVKCTRTSGPLHFMPTYRLECSDSCPDALCDVPLSGEKSAVQAFMKVQAVLKKPH
jgi:hypothetical protein